MTMPPCKEIEDERGNEKTNNGYHDNRPDWELVVLWLREA
jgi:hypothetical protein